MELQIVLETLRDEVETAPKLPEGTIVRIIRSMREGRVVKSVQQSYAC